jgi:hypothetical protein
MTDKNRALVELAESPDARFWKIEFDQLTEPEKVFMAVWELEAEVNNGGFDQYYWNSSGDIAYFASTALDAIGATKAAQLVREANSVFPNSQPPKDRTSRQQLVDKARDTLPERLNDFDQRFFEYPDDLTELLYDFVVAHRNEIAGA